MNRYRRSVVALLCLTVCITSGLAQFPARNRYSGGYMYNFYMPPSASTPWLAGVVARRQGDRFLHVGLLWKIKVGDTTAYELTANKNLRLRPGVVARRAAGSFTPPKTARAST